MHGPQGEKQRMLEKQIRNEWKMMTMTNDNSISSSSSNNKLKALHGFQCSSLHFYCLYLFPLMTVSVSVRSVSFVRILHMKMIIIIAAEEVPSKEADTPKKECCMKSK